MIRTLKSHPHGGCLQLVGHCAHLREVKTTRSSGRLAKFPDVKISKRPNYFPRVFRSDLERSGRSGRLSGVSYWADKQTCFSPYVDRIGKHVLNVRTSGNDSNHSSQPLQNRKVISL
jgi:hypothetical protein